MIKQKICIIGGGLTGLITAITLSKLNLKIDLITDNINKNNKSSRTIAISKDNYDFLKKLKVFQFSKKAFWSCSKIKLYTAGKNEKFTEIFEFNSRKKPILYMIHNYEIIKQMIKNIKKDKKISFKVQKKINEIVSSGLLKSVKFKNKTNSKYNLIISCTGSNSGLTKKISKNEPFEYSYKETSVTTVLQHNSIKNNVARQFFLDNEIFALLPISNTKTSIVWTVKKNTIEKYKSKNNFIFKKKIKFYTKDYLKKIKFISNLEFKNLNLLIRQKIYNDRVLLFGDAIHSVHPLAGQGFNMVLRDLESLKKVLKNKINLGLDIGSSDILLEFSNEIKPRNFIYTLGIDFIKNFFSLKEKNLKNFRNKFILKLNNNELVKDFFFNLADKGFKF